MEDFMTTKKFSHYIIVFITALVVLFILTSCENHSEISVSSPTNNVQTSPTPSPTKSPVRTKTFFYQFQSETEIKKLSATEIESADLNHEIVSVLIEYYDNSCYIVKVKWLSQPEYSKKLNILIDNVTSDSYKGMVIYDTVCKGVSDLFDLNHVYRNNESYSLEELEIVPEKYNDTGIIFSMDIEKGLFCPYYLGFATLNEHFEEHTVKWNSAVFQCSGILLNDDCNVEVKITI